MSVRKAAALAVAQLSVAAFFLSGITRPVLGESAALFVLASTLLGAVVRAIDIESWALLIPGGLVGRVAKAFGPRATATAVAAALVERLLLAALAAVVIGHYVGGVVVTAIAGLRFTRFARPQDLAAILAVAAVGGLWVQSRLGRGGQRDVVYRAIWIGVGILLVATAWGGASLLAGVGTPTAILHAPTANPTTAWLVPNMAGAYVLGLALTFTAVGGGEALAHAAHDFPPPRLPALYRTAQLTVLVGLLLTALGTFVVVLLVPGDGHALWVNAPLAALTQHLIGPAWARDVMALAVAGASAAVLLPAVHAAVGDAERLLRRSAAEGALPSSVAALHSRLGTPARAGDLTVMAVVGVIFSSGGQVAWLARAYAMAIATTLVLTIAALVRLRRAPIGAQPFRVPLNLRIGSRELPVGLLVPGLLAVTSALFLLGAGDVASISAIAAIAVLAFWLTVGKRQVAPHAVIPDEDAFELLQAAEVSLDQIEARPGNILVPVRDPHSLAHVLAALQTAGDRDVVVMTVRLLDRNASDGDAEPRAPTADERRLLSDVVALAERVGRPVRLLVVPAHNVIDEIVSTVSRLRSSDVYVGESATLSSAEQARLLGEAWERTQRPDALDVRLVVYHRSGRAETYHLGAHPPALSSGDLDLIHRLWLDGVKSVGPHVHHHDIVRAALTQMAHQLSGPQRDEALTTLREVARPAEELTALLRARDYARLRDMLRNRHAGDVAGLLTALSLEDRVIVFRVLPRKDAAAVFEYLSHEAKEALLKAMAQEEVAELLSSMAPDDRTLFLEELPAEATRQLLSLLTPAERAVAVTLLGYPEKSVGRLMTPHYVAAREEWTVQEVLDYVRSHGEDSETLNVIYVVDAQGLLIDDIRIRELLLAPLDRRMADLMDRRFVALKATDDQAAAVSVFRQYDRSALPVTDTAGMLIGIVTIDDVLDVAEAAATREIQRIGGSEALDEPYMNIGFARMIQKRAGWLTALFLGEMLTATAMGAFEAEISRAVVLALFVPLIISSGGNSGSQASTLVIRALALGEVGIRDWWRVMRRELLAGVTLGGILGGIGFLRITLWSAFSDIYGPHWLLVAFTVACSLVGVVLWGTLSGSLLPFVLKRLGFDPAASSAPFVATLVDVTGLVIYFSVALVVLRGTLL